MQSGAILEGHVTASSQWDGNHAPPQARLHYKPPAGKAGSWSARTNDANQWLKVDLGTHSRVTRVASQGRYASNQWVTKYKLQFGDDGNNFMDYQAAPGVAATVGKRFYYTLLPSVCIPLEYSTRTDKHQVWLNVFS